MDPLSLGLAAAQFGFSALGSFNERDQQRDQVRQANRQIRITKQLKHVTSTACSSMRTVSR